MKAIRKWFNNGIEVRKSILFKSMVLFLVPIACFSIFSFLLYNYYMDFFINDTEKNFSNALINIANNVNNVYNEIYLTNKMLSSDKNITNILDSSIVNSQDNITNEYNTIQSLRRLCATKNIIDNVFILDQSYNHIVSSNGTTTTSLFFNTTYKYADYSLGYWMNRSININNFYIMKPSIVTNTSNGFQTTVIPIVQSGIGDFASTKLFVVNLKVNELQKMLQAYKFTPHSSLIISNMDGSIYASSQELAPDFSRWMTSRIAKSLNTDLSISVENYKGSMMLLMQFPRQVLSNNFVYAACIPMTDINDKTSYMKNLSIIAMVITFVLSLMLSFFFAVKQYNPVRKMVEMLKKQSLDKIQGSTGNEIDFISNTIKKMFAVSETLSKELIIAQPIVGEQYLLKILNQDEFFYVENIEESLSRGGIHFLNPRFCTMIMHFLFSKEFYSSFGKDEKHDILQNMLELLHTVFPSDIQMNLLQVEREKICFIFNFSGSDRIADITSSLQTFYSIFNQEENCLQIFTGIGRAYEGYQGMIDSYKEAQQALSMLPRFGRERIKTYGGRNPREGFDFTIDDEDKLFNYLMKGMKCEIDDLLQIIASRNSEKQITEENLKELYLQMYFIGRRAAKYKGINLKVNDDEDIDIASRFHKMTLEDIYRYNVSFFECIIKNNDAQEGRINISKVKEFIDSNYKNDIYLEQLAEKYSVSPAHLSRLLKKAVGMSFQQYLSHARISKAKELLKSSKIPIGSIAKEVGFNNRNTFVRLFKKIEGITPSEYIDMINTSKLD